MDEYQAEMKGHFPGWAGGNTYFFQLRSDFI
jgi:hypothetical protein